MIADNPYLLTLVSTLCFFSLWFLVAMKIKDNGIVDVLWGLALIFNSWIIYLNFELPFGSFLPILVTLSQCRLSLHIFIRNRNKKEDWRYANWRKSWGSTFIWRSFLQIFMLQGIINWMMLFPLMDLTMSVEFGIWQYLGAAIWLFGTIYEAIGDYQLLQFKRDVSKKEQIMMSGLWSKSRHPNYFGQIVHWIGIFIIVAPLQLWYISIISPILITFLLTRVSGVPMLEAKYDDNPTFQAYKKRVPALIPRLF